MILVQSDLSIVCSTSALRIRRRSLRMERFLLRVVLVRETTFTNTAPSYMIQQLESLLLKEICPLTDVAIRRLVCSTIVFSLLVASMGIIFQTPKSMIRKRANLLPRVH